MGDKLKDYRYYSSSGKGNIGLIWTSLQNLLSYQCWDFI